MDCKGWSVWRKGVCVCAYVYASERTRLLNLYMQEKLLFSQEREERGSLCI